MTTIQEIIKTDSALVPEYDGNPEKLESVIASIRALNPIEDNLDGTTMIPPRCEIFKQIVINKDDQDYVTISNEIAPGVVCANSIFNKNNPIVKIVNTNNYMVKLQKNFEIQITPLKIFNKYTFDKVSENRNEKLFSELNLNKVPSYVQKDFKTLCEKFNDVFSLKDDFLTCNNFYKQNINLNDPSPVYIKNDRTPEVHKEEIKKQVAKMLHEDIIQPSVSPYNSPILLVLKKSSTDEKKWRLVVDFRQLNKKIIADKFPLPRIDDILDQLGRARYFSTLDLMSGFHQIELNDESKQFTAFSTDSGHFEFNRLPFGLNISPNSFQRMMTIALSGLPPECAFLYIDDIIITGCSIKHHLKNIEHVFQRLRKYNLKLNPAKCKFFCAEVTYLGHHISDP